VSAQDLARDLKQREQQHLKAKGITRAQLMQSVGYAEGYGVGVARRLAGCGKTRILMSGRDE
jgi:hypothetical protein